jgi:hypothetical protein
LLAVPLLEMIQVLSFGQLCEQFPWEATVCGSLTVFTVSDEFLDTEPEPPMEELCMLLEKSFVNAKCLCTCCCLDLSLRCEWCQDAKGWHRCLAYYANADNRHKTLSDADALRWAPNTLYNIDGSDIDRVVLDKIQRATPCQQILTMLEKLHEEGLLPGPRYLSLSRLVSIRCGQLVDDGSLPSFANQRFVLSHNMLDNIKCSPKIVEQKLQDLVQDMQLLWDPVSKTRKHYTTMNVASPPSQHLAFEQLVFRYIMGAPLFVCTVAPAGHGKSTLIAAWLLWLYQRGARWEVAAATGIAASQVAGVTLHSLLLADTDFNSKLHEDREKQNELRSIEGYVLDEAMMLSWRIVEVLMEVSQQYPLHHAKRRSGALPHFGYRDVLLFGDLRQIPPSSHEFAQPFWSSTTFQRLFEIFYLAEDRRHERNPAMKEIKELVAWGGVSVDMMKKSNEDATTACTKDWPVDVKVMKFVVEGYIRGWGMSGETVDLDLGTAIFSRRADASRWNDACVRQIEQKYRPRLNIKTTVCHLR